MGWAYLLGYGINERLLDVHLDDIERKILHVTNGFGTEGIGRLDHVNDVGLSKTESILDVQSGARP